MTRSKFLQELRGALSGRLPERAVKENVEFYDSYIKEEVRNGRDEEEVLQMLGDPALIARTITDVPKNSKKRSSRRSAKEYFRRNENFFKLTSWKKTALIVGCILLSVIFTAVVKGLMRFILPVLFPALGIFVIIKIVRKK